MLYLHTSNRYEILRELLPAHLAAAPENLEDFGGSLSAIVREKAPEAIEYALRWLAQWSAPGEEIIGNNPAGALSMATYEAGRPSQALAWRKGDARFLNLLCEQEED